MTVEPASPVSEAITQCLPMRQLCPIWTRLSIFVPAPTTVLPVCARSMQRVRADLDVVFEHDVSDLRNSLRPSVHEGPAEPVAADHAARMQDDAVADYAAVGNVRAGADDGSGSDRGAVADVRVRLNVDVGGEARIRRDAALG